MIFIINRDREISEIVRVIVNLVKNFWLNTHGAATHTSIHGKIFSLRVGTTNAVNYHFFSGSSLKLNNELINKKLQRFIWRGKKTYCEKVFHKHLSFC